jgi:hypothetical protein
MKKKFMGDFGAMPRSNADFGGHIVGSNQAMGDFWSDLKDDIESWGDQQLKDLEKSVAKTLQDNTSWLPPQLRKDAEKAIREAGGQLTAQARAELEKKAAELLKAEAEKQLTNPENQNLAIQAGVMGAAKKLEMWLISVKDSILNPSLRGGLWQNHPMVIIVPSALGGIWLIKKGLQEVGKGKAKVALGELKKNPSKRRRYKVRKFKI